MKKLVSVFAAIVMLCSCSLVQATEIGVYVNDQYVRRDVQNVAGFDMLPILDIAGEMGFYCHFDGTTAVLYNHDNAYYFTLNQPAVYDKSGKEYGLDVVPQMMNGKLMVPAKFFQDVFGWNYLWEPITKAVFLNSDESYYWLVNSYEYKNPRMYASDGRFVTVSRAEVAFWEKLGWCQEPLIELYASDGRIATVRISEIYAFKNNGWLEAHEYAFGKSFKRLANFFGPLEFWGGMYGGEYYKTVDSKMMFAFPYGGPHTSCTGYSTYLYRFLPEILVHTDADGFANIFSLQGNSDVYIEHILDKDEMDGYYTVRDDEGNVIFYAEYGVVLYVRGYRVIVYCDENGRVRPDSMVDVFPIY